MGCGAGWMREEFEAIGTPPFDNRGSVSDEYIRVFKELWTSDAPAFEGSYAKFSDIIFSPQPVQKPHPPIWIGRRKPRRSATGRPPGRCLVSHRQQPHLPPCRPSSSFQKPSAVFTATLNGSDATPAEIDLAFSAGWYNEKEARTGPDGGRLTFTGTPRQIADDILSFRKLGVRHLMLGFQGTNPRPDAGADGLLRLRDHAPGGGIAAIAQFPSKRAGRRPSS